MDTVSGRIIDICSAGGRRKLMTNLVDQTDRLNRPPFVIVRRGLLREVWVELNVPGLQICKYHCSSKGCEEANCRSLHICRDFVLSTCDIGEKCNNGHVLTDAHNRAALSTYGLGDDISQDALRALLRLNRTEVTLPKECLFYNIEKGCSKPVTGKNACRYLHVCQYFLTGTCKYGGKCKRAHQLDASSQAKTILDRYGISGSELLICLQGFDCETGLEDSPFSRSSSADSGPSLQAHQNAQSTTRRGQVICTFNLVGNCAFGSKCRNHHSSLPYQWQMEVDGNWQDCSSELETSLEEKYCNLAVTTVVQSHNVDFIKSTITTTTGVKNLRRLGTVSAAKSEGVPFATEWDWFWIDLDWRYTPYGKQGCGGNEVTMDGALLEEQYQNYLDGRNNGKFKFNACNNDYEVDFKAFCQKNLKNGTELSITRRPRFHMTKAFFARKLSEFEQQHVIQAVRANNNYPSEWVMSSGTEKATSEPYQLFLVSPSSPEYTKVASAFHGSFPVATVTKIERIQNHDLWEEYSRMKEKMKKKAPSGIVQEKLLFHGTRARNLYSICRQGFDHRVAGISTGTVFGQGTYFTTNAKSAFHYTFDCDMILVASVLVGDYTLGHSEYRRPPPKDPRVPFGELYDSVVDKYQQPTIYVIFNDHQSYPNYIVHYAMIPNGRLTA